jgi:hypothetical protein
MDYVAKLTPEVMARIDGILLGKEPAGVVGESS